MKRVTMTISGDDEDALHRLIHDLTLLGHGVQVVWGPEQEAVDGSRKWSANVNVSMSDALEAPAGPVLIHDSNASGLKGLRLRQRAERVLSGQNPLPTSHEEFDAR
jgi:hypothetical protein